MAPGPHQQRPRADDPAVTGVKRVSGSPPISDGVGECSINPITTAGMDFSILLAFSAEESKMG